MSKKEEQEGSVICRSNGVGYAASGLCVIYGALVFFLSSDQKSHVLPLGIRLSIAGVFLLCAVFSICWEWVRHITASAEGITWRTLIHERRSRWDEVTDYYETQDPRSTGHLLAVIITTSGCVQIGRNNQWKGTKALREMIQRYATTARSGEFEVLGTRPCDPWPRTFRYSRTALKWQAATAGVLGAVYLPITITLLWQGTQQSFGILGLRAMVLFFCMAVLITSPLGIGLLLFSQHSLRVLRRYGSESLEVTLQGLTFMAGTRVITANWSDVGDYHIAAAKNIGAEYVLSLRGADETRIAWSGWISESWLLARIVEKYAPHPISAQVNEQGWRYESADAAIADGAGPAQSRFTISGGKTFCYRNGVIRFSLLCATFIVVIIALLPSLFWFLGLETRSSLNGLVCIAAVTGIALFYSWWRYFVGGIEIDDFWITQRTLFGKRRIAWISVTDYKSVNGPYIVFGQKGMPIVLWSSISRFTELKAEIECRAPSPLTGWKKCPPKRVL